MPEVTRRQAALAGAFIVLVIAPLVAVAVRSTMLTRPAGAVLEIEMQATGGTAAQLFWTQDWGFYHERSTVLPLHRRPDGFETLRFPLPDRPLLHLRFDPLDAPGEVVIRSVRLLDRQGHLVRSIDPLAFAPLHQIERLVSEADGTQLRVVTDPGALDPMLLLNPSALTAPPRWYDLTVVTPFWLGWVAAASCALIVSAIGVVLLEIRRGPILPRQVLWFIAVFVTIVAAKLLLLRAYPMPVPFWDQWDGEGFNLYLPFHEATLGWRQMFELHNEHRIFFTRVLAVVLVALDGQWDPQLQMTVNAFLHATVATVLAAVSWLALGRRWLPVLAGTVLLAVAPPFAIENTLAGFQSAFYFLVLFAVMAVWLMTSRRPGSAGWALGWLCALASIVTVAGGVLTAAALAVSAGLRLASAPRAWRRSLLEFAAIGVVVAVGYTALPPPVAAHAVLKAETSRSLIFAFTHCLAFPWIERLKPAGLLWLPVAALGGLVILRRLRTTEADRWTLALAAWIVAQAAAVAYSRGVGGNPPASRYLDMFALGLPVNVCALLIVAAGEGGRRRRAAWTAGLIWIVLGAVGVGHLSARMVATEASQRRAWMRQYERNVGRFLASPDFDWFLTLHGPLQIPFSRPPLLAAMLSHPYFRNVMPAAVRPPIPLTAAEAGDHAFARAYSPVDPAPIWESYGAGPGGRTFISTQARCRSFPYMAIPIAGDLDDNDLSLEVRPLGGTPVPVRVTTGLGGWTLAVVRCPDGPFTLEARDGSATAWFALKQPVELGWLSALTLRLIRRAPLLLLLALSLCGAAVTLSLTAPDHGRGAAGGEAPESA
jgi:hypothetical protein